MQQTLPTTKSNGSSSETAAAAPKVLLLENSRWSVVAMLAVRLAKAGMNVFAVCPVHHPLLKTRAVQKIFPYSALHPLESLNDAVEAVNPDIIIPSDDRAVGHLHELYFRARQMGPSHAALAALIEKSIGSPDGYSIVSARYDLLRIAREEGLRIPETAPIKSESDLKSLQGRQGFPWVLKADGTGNGCGVRIARTPGEAVQFLAELTRYYRLGRAIKRMLVNRDPFWLRPWWQGVKPSVIVQSYIEGHPANCGVFCWKGKVLAGIGVEVASETGPMAHASVTRVVDNPDMMLCAERIARRLNMSGFFGLDFMIEKGTGLAYLIEMNPRPTRLSSLRLGKGRDLIGALVAQLTGQPVCEAPSVTQKDLIAYFPEAWDSKSELLESSYHDIPQGEDDLLQELRRPWPRTTLLWRLTDYAEQLKRSLGRHLTKRQTTARTDWAIQRHGKH
jgi:hypothetical protein